MSKIQKQSHLAHLGAVDPLRVVTDAFGVMRPKEAIEGTAFSKRELSILSQKNAQPSTLNSAVLNFELDNSIDKIHEILLRMTVSESGAANSYVMMNVFHALNYLEIEFSTGEKYRIEGYELFLWYLAQVNTDELAAKDAVWNVGSTLGAGATIAASGTLEVYLPCTLFLRDLVPRALRQQIIKMNFHFASNVVESGTGTHALDSCSLYVVQDVLNDQELEVYNQLYFNSKPYAIKFLDPITQVNNESLTSGTAITRTMSQISGLCPFILLGVRAQNPVGTTTPRTFYAVTDFTLLESSGGNITQTLTAQWMTYDAVNEGHFQNKGSALFANLTVYPVIFCQDVDKAWNGTVTGFKSFSGSEQFRLTPAATASRGVEVTAFCYADIFVSGGQIHIHSSK